MILLSHLKLLLFLFLLVTIASSLVSLEPDYVHQDEDFECQLEKVFPLPKNLVIDCQDFKIDAVLTGTFNNKSELLYFCSTPVMTVVLHYENNATFCFHQQENLYPIPFKCHPSNIPATDITCEMAFKYYKTLYLYSPTLPPSFTTQPRTSPATTSPLSAFIQNVTPENKDSEIVFWKSLALGFGSGWALSILLIVGAALYLCRCRKPKVTSGNSDTGYTTTPLLKDDKRCNITGTLVTHL